MAITTVQGRLPAGGGATVQGEALGNGYDAYLGDLGNLYQELAGAIESQRSAQLARLQAQYDAAAAELERQRPTLQQNYEDTAQQAYIQNMLSKRDLPQQLAAQGLNGGMSESSQLALETEYGNQLNAARKQYNQNLYDLDTQIGKVRAAGADAMAGAEGDYNSMLAEARNNYLTNAANARLQAQLAALENQRYADQLAYQKEQDALSQRNWQAQFDYQKEQDALSQKNWLMQYNASLAKSRGSGGSGGTGGGTENVVETVPTSSNFTLGDKPSQYDQDDGRGALNSKWGRNTKKLGSNKTGSRYTTIG